MLENILYSALAGGGIGWLFARLWVKDVARDALKEELQLKEKEIEELKREIRNIRETYVQCKYCELQYESVSKMFNSIDKKLNIILPLLQQGRSHDE